MQYIDFFENRGLIKGDRNEGCYCVWHHWTDEQEINRSKLPINEQPDVKRNYAIELIKAGKLNGFAAFQDEKMIGFCNADAKENYYRLSRENYPNSWNGLENDDNVLSIVCFVIDVGMRGQGVATALLKEIMNYAVVHKFDYMEAYPSAGEFNTANCCGPVSMYEKQGFSIIHNNNSEVIVRKKIM
jgi:ribosomal protein S18 acetylase RimI-like enzyme